MRNLVWLITIAMMLPGCSTTGKKIGSVDVPSESPQSGRKTYKAGDVVRFEDWTVAVLRVQPDWVPESQFGRPEPEERYIAIEFQVTNKGSKVDSSAIGPIFCNLRHASGAEYGAIPIEPTPPLETSNIPPNETRTGWVTFKVPKASSELLLLCQPDPFTKLTWNLGL
jgi:hypothetical protein